MGIPFWFIAVGVTAAVLLGLYPSILRAAEFSAGDPVAQRFRVDCVAVGKANVRRARIVSTPVSRVDAATGGVRSSSASGLGCGIAERMCGVTSGQGRPVGSVDRPVLRV